MAKWKRVVLLALLAALLYVAAFIALIHTRSTVDTTEQSDVIIVLGAGLLRDGRPSYALARRSRQGAELWRQGIAPVVLCAGGQAETYPRSEAAACREILLRAGVPDSAILLEEKSRSTEENAIFSREILDEMGAKQVVIVSDSFHMMRAKWLFQQNGNDPFTSPVPAELIRQRYFYPYSLVREFLAFQWYFLKEIFGIPLTHLTGI